MTDPSVSIGGFRMRWSTWQKIDTIGTALIVMALFFVLIRFGSPPKQNECMSRCVEACK